MQQARRFGVGLLALFVAALALVYLITGGIG
jgi:hypothetical protein